MKVVFVCLGNICRSPMAEAIFRSMVEANGLTSAIEIDSAATSSWEQGNPVHQGTKQKLASVGISTKGMYSRQLEEKDLEADFLVGMDEANLKELRRFVGDKTQPTVVKLLEFAGSQRDIADPWYTGDFEKTYQDVLEGCRGLLDYLKEQIKEKNNESSN